MKKALIASTALVMTAGVAAADVKLTGYGRTALDYQEDRGVGLEDTQLETRLRFNIDATASTDQGIDFGGRIRLQYDDNNADSVTSPGYVYVSASGLKVSFGNVGTAYDSAALLYESEVGLISRSYGNSMGDYYSFTTSPYSQKNRMGVAVEYSIAGVTAMASYVDPDQTTATNGGMEEELSISLGYELNNIQLSAAAVKDGNGIADNNQFFVGAYYTLAGTSNGIGLNYIDNGPSGADSKTIVVYGDYEVAPMTTVSAYIANNDKVGNKTDSAFGIGAKYDLGGALLAGSVERSYMETVRADMGIKFNF